ncbi:GOLPH3/VPS74 family protein [Roseimarinus sediminis]|uniref:GOLPH3/VPS74 family protein n=1 Tax=Roseimarinus sediminis TaxID=1610899 RepID=UPI003D214EDA
MEPKLSRDFFLLSLNPKNGYYFNYGSEFGYGLLGAMLADLYRCGKIRFENKKVVLIDASPGSYPYFNQIIDLLQRKGKISISGLLGRMAFKSGFYKKELIKTLSDNGDLIMVRKKFLLIPYKRYFPAKRDERMETIRHFRNILLRNQPPVSDDLLFMSLIHICRLYRSLSDMRDERRIMRSKMKLLLKNGYQYSENYDQLKALHSGIKQAIMAAHATKGTASGI